MIAESDAILALDVKEILKQAGAEIVGPAATLRNTLSLLFDGPVSAAVLDVNLLDDDVFPAALALEECGAGIVFHTAFADVAGLRRTWPRAQVLEKPTSPELLVTAVHQACRPLLNEDVL